jgi:hypothetical protein
MAQETIGETALQAAPTLVEYELCIQVRDTANSGSDSDVFATLTGQGQKTITKWKLDNVGVADNKRGAYSCFQFTASDADKADIGQVDFVELTMNSGTVNDICYDYFDVTRTVKGQGSIKTPLFTATGNDQMIISLFEYPQCLGNDVSVKTSGTRFRTGLAVLPEPATDEPTDITVSGYWTRVDQCRGAECISIKVEMSQGVKKGEEVSKTSTVGRSLSVMTGGEIKADTGILPGGEVTAKFEVTGEWTHEHAETVANSFTFHTERKISATCGANSSLWQWVSELHVYSGAGETVTIAPSSINVCTGVNNKPKSISDITWQG